MHKCHLVLFINETCSKLDAPLEIHSNFDLRGKNLIAFCPYFVFGPFFTFPDFRNPMYHPKWAYFRERYVL